MNFYIPTKIYFSDNCVKNYGHEIANYGKNALIVTGKKSAKISGAIDDVLFVLKNNNIAYTIFDEVTENPETKTVDEGSKLCSQKNCDMVIAIGGGSPIDAAKAIALQVANKLSIDQLFDSSLHKKALPIIAVPTTAGTGSEVTPYSVLNQTETNKKAGFGSDLLFPRIAFLDARYTLSLNWTITRDTAVDALSHLLEGIYSVKFNPFLTPFIFTGISLILNHLHPALHDLKQLQSRQFLMLASNYGGIVIAHTSTTLQHSIGYPLTTEFGVSHGLANGLVMKPIMNLYESEIKPMIDTTLMSIGIDKQQLFAWLDTLDLKFTGKIDENFLSQRVPEVLASRNMALTPVKVTEKDILSIYSGI